MANDLRQTWGSIAEHWDDWGPPLRPCAEDLQITIDAIKTWHAKNPVEKARVFLCGVTPEIVTMDWPLPVKIFAMDQAASMVKHVWPGDIPGVRRAVVGSWMDSDLPLESKDIIIGDGGFVFFGYPDAQRNLAHELSRILKPGGLFIYRHYASPQQRESIAQIRSAANARQIGNFHIFKWRLAMALEQDKTKGVRLQDIWQAFMDMRIDTSTLPQPGWSERAVNTIHFYREKDARLYFPTLNEFHSLLNDNFDDIQITLPTYELGERCPFLVGRKTR